MAPTSAALDSCLFTFTPDQFDLQHQLHEIFHNRNPYYRPDCIVILPANMPGKVAARNSTASRLPRKSSAQTLASRKSTTSRISSPTIVIPEEGPTSTLRTRICDIFSAAQRTTAGHRKLVVGLRKIQEACCYEQANTQGQDGFEEDDFNVELARCVIRLMGVKKSESVGDRIVNYLGLFLRHASDKGI